ncbi:MAG: hypothetical protein OXG03_05045 [Gammaproteobacteria bacterium]|nr:hypothetical protein [Gammaproteobacteria bacterium]
MKREIVLTEEKLEEILADIGYERSSQRITTGWYWIHRETNRMILIPDAVDGGYTKTELEELEKIIKFRLRTVSKKANGQ